MSSNTSSIPVIPRESPESPRHGFSFASYRKSLRLKSVRVQQWWRLHKRAHDGWREHDWWLASTAIPLLAATLGPLANVLSIAALVTYWRMDLLVDGQVVPELNGIPFRDPRWCYWLNVASLIVGFVGNFFLLMNFTQRIRYIIALPMTIILWYIATGILIGITVCIHMYTPPIKPYQTYTQGFWYAVEAAVLYFICSMILMINMLGYFLGHYPQTFTLTDAQRTLILQTMLYFIWLAGGGAIFSRIETEAGQQGWAFADGLYFCDVTILTVGFGDLYPTTDVARGIVFPYSVGGIVMLGLVITSIHNFVTTLGRDKIIQRHVDKKRHRAWSRTVTSSSELERRTAELHIDGRQVRISAPMNPINTSEARRIRAGSRLRLPIRRREPRLILLREERDRFDEMRRIQAATAKFKRWYALTLSTLSFSILWCVGAVVFWRCEQPTQGMTYFQALYFCYVSLLTIGYGDLSPKSNAGRSFFVLWSIIAVPTMTVLISDMGDTVITAFKNGTISLGDFTVLPKEGIWKAWYDKHPQLLLWLQEKRAQRAARKRVEAGFPTGPPEVGDVEAESDADADADADANGGEDDLVLEEVAAVLSEDDNVSNSKQGLEDADDGKDRANGSTPANPPRITITAPSTPPSSKPSAPNAVTLTAHLARAIYRVSQDVKSNPTKQYAYEDWVAFTRLIRDCREHQEEVEDEEDEEGLVDWDWIGNDSPLLGRSEAGFLLEKLTNGLVRVAKAMDSDKSKQERARKKQEGTTERKEGGSKEKGKESDV